MVKLKTSKFKPNPTTTTSIQNNNPTSSNSIAKIPSNYSLINGVGKINSPLKVESNNNNNFGIDLPSSKAINSKTNCEYLEVKISYSTYSIVIFYLPLFIFCQKTCKLKSSLSF